MSMPSTDLHKVWTEQCEAAKDIRGRHEQTSVLDYLIGEKLFRFLAASEHRPEFAAEASGFVNAIRMVFTPADIRAYLDRLERTKILASEPNWGTRGADDETEEDILPNDPVLGAEELLPWRMSGNCFRDNPGLGPRGRMSLAACSLIN